MAIASRILSCAVLIGAALPGSAQAVGYNPGYYRSVGPRQQSAPPCGHYLTPPCAPAPIGDVAIDANASADNIFAQGNALYSNRQFAAAMAYFKRAAELGNPRAQSSIGRALFEGTYVAQDIPSGIYWFRKAATAGNRGAQYWMGEIYSDGRYVSKNWTLAITWYRASANQRYSPAAQNLGFAYELGLGVSRSRATAIAWLRRAAVDGQDGLSQQYAAFLSRPSTPHFANETQLAAAFGQARDNVIAGVLRHPPGYRGTLHSCLSNSTNQQTGSYGSCVDGSR